MGNQRNYIVSIPPSQLSAVLRMLRQNLHHSRCGPGCPSRKADQVISASRFLLDQLEVQQAGGPIGSVTFAVLRSTWPGLQALLGRGIYSLRLDLQFQEQNPGLLNKAEAAYATMAAQAEEQSLEKPGVPPDWTVSATKEQATTFGGLAVGDRFRYYEQELIKTDERTAKYQAPDGATEYLVFAAAIEVFALPPAPAADPPAAEVTPTQAMGEAVRFSQLVLGDIFAYLQRTFVKISETAGERLSSGDDPQEVEAFESGDIVRRLPPRAGRPAKATAPAGPLYSKDLWPLLGTLCRFDLLPTSTYFGYNAEVLVKRTATQAQQARPPQAYQSFAAGDLVTPLWHPALAVPGMEQPDPAPAPAPTAKPEYSVQVIVRDGAEVYRLAALLPPVALDRPLYGYDDETRGQESPTGIPLNVHDALNAEWAAWRASRPEPDSWSQFEDWLQSRGWGNHPEVVVYHDIWPESFAKEGQA